MASATAMPTESVVDAETLMLHPRRNRREKSRTLLILPVSIWFGLRRESSRNPRHQRERNVSVVAAWHDGQYKFGFLSSMQMPSRVEHAVICLKWRVPATARRNTRAQPRD